MFKGNNSSRFLMIKAYYSHLIGAMSVPVTEAVNPTTENLDVASPIGKLNIFIADKSK